jgi:hypothetical protein
MVTSVFALECYSSQNIKGQKNERAKGSYLAITVDKKKVKQETYEESFAALMCRWANR